MPLYSSCNDNELWVAMIEKAFAKAHKGYVITTGGFTGIAITELTGAPSHTYSFQQRSFSTDNLW
jgi:calpain-15